MQALLKLVYPPRCVGCNGEVAEEGKLCTSCRLETPFVIGLACDLCGTPLLGHDVGPSHCDACTNVGRPWQQGRAALLYQGKARSMILGFKHGDRVDLAMPFAKWMVMALGPLQDKTFTIVPVPIHWTRLVRRRYNQAALLSREMAALTGNNAIQDALVRRRRTRPQDGMEHIARYNNVDGAIVANARRADEIKGKHILLVDDVMTSGATLSVCTQALLRAGADQVSVTVLARVAKYT